MAVAQVFVISRWRDRRYPQCNSLLKWRQEVLRPSLSWRKIWLTVLLPSNGLDFFDTGVQLITGCSQWKGIQSVTSKTGLAIVLGRNLGISGIDGRRCPYFAVSRMANPGLFPCSWRIMIQPIQSRLRGGTARLITISGKIQGPVPYVATFRSVRKTFRQRFQKISFINTDCSA